MNEIKQGDALLKGKSMTVYVGLFSHGNPGKPTGMALALSLKCSKCNNLWEKYQQGSAPLDAALVEQLQQPRYLTQGSTFKCPAVGCDNSEVLTMPSVD